jgi:hypothetical protein
LTSVVISIDCILYSLSYRSLELSFFFNFDRRYSFLAHLTQRVMWAIVTTGIFLTDLVTSNEQYFTYINDMWWKSCGQYYIWCTNMMNILSNSLLITQETRWCICKRLWGHVLVIIHHLVSCVINRLFDNMFIIFVYQILYDQHMSSQSFTYTSLGLLCNQ